MRSSFRIFFFLCFANFLITQKVYATYIFYRGYHFLSNADPIMDFSPKGIRSWAIAPGLTEEKAQEYAEKIKSLSRPWTKDEKSVFDSKCFSPLLHLVELYTNSYKEFTAQLRSPESLTRRILRLAGLEIDTNPFLSTSLKAEQAMRYGSGLKLYGNEHLRRYPQYNGAGDPTNHAIGILDIISIEDIDILNTGAFFVVESFARGDTRLSYHWRKKLTEEQEVIFPFIIPKKYHKSRLPLTVPTLRGALPGIDTAHWIGKLNTPEMSLNDKAKVELSLIQRLSILGSEKVEIQVAKFLADRKKSRTYLSPEFLYTQRLLIPDDAASMRKDILGLVDSLGRRYGGRGYGIRDVDVTSYLLSPTDRYIGAYALRSFGLTEPISFTAGVSLDGKFSFECLSILAETPGLISMRLTGPDTEGIYPEGYNDDMDYADRLIPLSNLYNSPPWRRPSRDFNLVVRALERRNQRGYGSVVLDVTGQSLHPKSWNTLLKVVELEDENRDEDEEAIEEARASMDGFM